MISVALLRKDIRRLLPLFSSGLHPNKVLAVEVARLVCVTSSHGAEVWAGLCLSMEAWNCFTKYIVLNFQCKEFKSNKHFVSKNLVSFACVA